MNAGPPSPLFVRIIFFGNPFRTQTAEAKQGDGIYLPYCRPAQPLGWFYHIIANLNSVQCSANHTLHANEKTVLPQEWSLLRYGVRRSWLLSSEQIRVVQREVYRFRESRRNIIPGSGKLLALTLLPSRRHLQIQKANRELAAARFALYTDSQVVQTSLILFIWKPKHLCTLQLASGLYFPSHLSFREAVNDYLPLQRLGIHGKTDLGCRLMYYLGPLDSDCWNTQQLVSMDFIVCPKSHRNHLASTAGTFISLCWRQ